MLDQYKKWDLMSRKSLLILTILLFLVCLQYPRFQQIRVNASSGYPVHNLNTGLNYTTIQEAINANETINKHTILVEAGSYDERITINKSISLIGQNRTDTLLNTKEYFWGTSINVTCDDAEVADFSFPLTFLTKIWVGPCSNVTIRNNIIRSTRQCIVLNGSHGCSIKENDISGPGLEENDLFLLMGASGCIIENNSVLNACYDGIGMYSSSNNVICNNMISHNQYGIEFHGANTGNSIFHNNFVSNHPFQVSGIAGSNIWDNGLEGNYWSDYNGTDSNQDGIGDTPYTIDQYNVDHYPLMGRFQSFNVSGRFSLPSNPFIFEEVDIISTSTIGKVEFTWGDDVRSPTGVTTFLFLSDVTGQNDTAGFCRITFPKNMFNSSRYPVFIGNLSSLFDMRVDINETSNRILWSNSTHTTLYFSYSQPAPNTSEDDGIFILPEFPSFLVMPLFMIATLLVMIGHKRRHLT